MLIMFYLTVQQDSGCNIRGAEVKYTTIGLVVPVTSHKEVGKLGICDGTKLTSMLCVQHQKHDCMLYTNETL